MGRSRVAPRPPSQVRPGPGLNDEVDHTLAERLRGELALLQLVSGRVLGCASTPVLQRQLVLTAGFDQALHQLMHVWSKNAVRLPAPGLVGRPRRPLREASGPGHLHAPRFVADVSGDQSQAPVDACPGEASVCRLASARSALAATVARPVAGSAM